MCIFTPVSFASFIVLLNNISSSFALKYFVSSLNTIKTKEHFIAPLFSFFILISSSMCFIARGLTVSF